MISLAKNLNYSAVLILATLFFSACNQKKEAVGNTLSVTIEPQRYFLEQIVGDKYKVVALVPAGNNPESFDPAPSQMIALDKSLIYFKVGFLGIENTLIDKVKNQSTLKIVDCSKGITIIAGHEHHDDEDNNHHHAHAGGDPHYWSSISSAKMILNNMYEAVVKLDPKNKEFYTSNYNSEIAKINDTDSIITSLLQKSNSKAFVIYHPALSYFAEEYKIEQLCIEHEGKNPSPTQLKELIDEAKEKGVKCVFIQQEFDIKNAKTIALQISAKTQSINLLAYEWHNEMKQIAEAIAKGND